MSLTDSVQQLEDYLNHTISSGNRLFTASANRSAAQPDGQLVSDLQKQTSSSTLDSLKNNPVVSTTIDTVNQAVTSIAQQVVTNAISKVNLTPIQNATQQFFTLFASVTSFGVEVAMQFARNTGNNAIAAIRQKSDTATQLDAEIVALYNACALLLNGQPFFDQYLKNIIQALALIQQADVNLKSMVTALQNPNGPVYQARKFDLSVSQLTQAQNLILPNRGVDVSSIRSATDFISSVITRQSNQQAYAAAISIPGITLTIGKLILQYELQSVNVNAFLNTYLRALDDYIEGYKQSNSVNQATIDHLNAGISQIDALLVEMATILRQNTGSATDITFRAKLSSYGTKWGVTLAAIIAWLKLNPGAGSALLTQTSQSVAAYTRSVKLIGAIGDTKFTGGTVFVNGGEEDAFKGLIPIAARIMLTANTIVVTSSNSRASVLAQARAVRNYCSTSKLIDGQIIAAITPFINTKTTLSGPVAQGVSTLIGFANKMGLDRIVGLLTNGDVKNLFAATPDTATYAGAAVVGINSILTTIKDSPNATDQQVSQIENLRDQVQREQKAQEVYTGRQAQFTEAQDNTAQQKKIDNSKTLVTTAKEAAKQVDADAANDPVNKTQVIMNAQVTPNQLPDAADMDAKLFPS